MSPPPVSGALEPGGLYFSLPRGSLALSSPRELLVSRSVRGACEPDGSPALDTLRLTTQLLTPESTPTRLAAEDVVREDGEAVIWGGFLDAPYGHFLTEEVSRLWPLLPGGKLEGLPVVFTSPGESRFALEWLEVFGARLVELPERGVVRFARVFVPEPALRFNAWIAPEIREIHLRARQGMGIAPSSREGVLWLSRSRFARRRPYDESLLEWLLGEHVRVIHPETMTLVEQVAAFESSRAVAGVVGSAFHTLLMTEDPPECLYLCPPWDKPSYGAQHRLLNTRATFAEALSVALWTNRAPRGSVAFPRGYRLSIPKALGALGATVLPAVREDPRLRAFADLEPSAAGHRSWTNEVDAALARMLLDPLSAKARMELGEILEAEGLDDCAREQFAMAADLTGEGLGDG